ncbi:MAG: hypothetical protein U0835_11320 [Isosphaeraceae bacterium]
MFRETPEALNAARATRSWRMSASASTSSLRSRSFRFSGRRSTRWYSGGREAACTNQSARMYGKGQAVDSSTEAAVVPSCRSPYGYWSSKADQVVSSQR